MTDPTQGRTPTPAASALRTFIAYVEDRPGVLNRLVSLFRRRGYNIESLASGRAARPDVAHITFVVQADSGMARRIAANLYKLVNVLHVTDVTHAPAVVREMALIKVGVSADHRVEILGQVARMGARVIDESRDHVLFEATGTTAEIDAVVAALAPHGIREMVRTGAIAMTRGAAADLALPPARDDGGPDDPADDEVIAA